MPVGAEWSRRFARRFSWRPDPPSEQTVARPVQKLAAEATRLVGARSARALAHGGREARDHQVRTRKNTMRTICLMAPASMLLAGSASQAPAQEAGHDSHHPAAGAGGPAPEPSPEFGAMPETMAPGPSKGGAMCPDMGCMMPVMMKYKCAI
jgi:hypothetical protein